MKHILYSLLFVLLLLSTCQKHKTYHIDPCEELVYLSETSFDFNFITEGTFYVRASFNPNNSNEIVFIDKQKDIVQIYNIKTQVKRTVYEGLLSPTFSPKWGKKNWILLSLGRNVYKVKSDGDSLIQLTFNNTAFAPGWNIEADNFFYNTGGYVWPPLTIICDENGVPLDSLQNSMLGSWQHDSLLLLNDNWNGIITYNPRTKARKRVSNVSPSVGSAGSIQWIDDEHYIEANALGIYMVNYKTHEFTTLPIDVCFSSRIYRIEGFSKQSQKLIFSKREREILAGNKMKQRFSIVVMNTDGTEEAEIIIPE